jgi:hypothetical protein
VLRAVNSLMVSGTVRVVLRTRPVQFQDNDVRLLFSESKFSKQAVGSTSIAG